MGLTNEQRKKVSEAASAIELRALKDILTRQRAGRKLTGADLRLLERLQRQKHTIEEGEAPVGPCDMRWLPIPDVVALIGGTEQGIRGWTRKKSNPLPSRRVNRSVCVQPWTTYEYAAKFARNVKGLRAPGPAAETHETAPEAPIIFEGDPHQVLLQALKTLQGGSILSPQSVQAIAAAARELRQKTESDIKSARQYEAETVVKMLQEHRDIFIEEIEASAEPDSIALLEYIKEKVGIDLAVKNVAAAKIVESLLRKRANRILDRLRERVLAQTEIVEAEKRAS